MTDKPRANRTSPSVVHPGSRENVAIDKASQLFHDGLALQQQGRLVQAAALYAEMLREHPAQPDALHMLGVIALQEARAAQAVDLIRDSLLSNPGNASAHMNLGLSLKALGQVDEALAAYAQAIALRSDYAQAHNSTAVALQDSGRWEDALASFDKAIACKPDYAQAHYNRGVLLHQQKRSDLALASFQRAIDMQPAYPQALNNRGVVSQEMQRLDAALADFKAAVALAPDYAQAWFNQGHILAQLGQFAASLASYDKAIACEPRYAQAFNNRGLVLQALGQTELAIASYQQAIQIAPDYADAYWNKAIDLLLTGDFEQGWPLYEWRWQRDTFTSRKRNFAQPLWLGQEPLHGKSLLLHAEQGLGDSIQFCRYAQLVKARGARVLLEVPRVLVRLFGSLEGVDVLVPQGDPLPDFDYHCPLLSLPLAFHTRVDTIPSPSAYLQSDTPKRESWLHRLGERTQTRIGLVWSGNALDREDRHRSIPLAALLACLPNGPRYVCLQKELRASDRSALEQSGILFFGDVLHDFSDTAALCDCMDLVISVDTSVAHLAAALGKPTWIALPFAPDWRWMLHRQDSPWYPSARLYRQDRERGWGPVLARLGDDLGHFLSQAFMRGSV
jgi:tetratricopeptide (TPR) repeat protein